MRAETGKSFLGDVVGGGDCLRGGGWWWWGAAERAEKEGQEVELFRFVESYHDVAWVEIGMDKVV